VKVLMKDGGKLLKLDLMTGHALQQLDALSRKLLRWRGHGTGFWNKSGSKSSRSLIAREIEKFLTNVMFTNKSNRGEFFKAQLAPSEKFEQWRPARCVREAWA
jgi:hypothetical protein